MLIKVSRTQFCHQNGLLQTQNVREHESIKKMLNSLQKCFSKRQSFSSPIKSNSPLWDCSGYHGYLRDTGPIFSNPELMFCWDVARTRTGAWGTQCHSSDLSSLTTF